MGASSAAGRVLFGIFADKIGRLAAFKISVVLSALSVYFWLLCGDNFGMMAAFSVMYGVFGGSVLGLLTVAVAEVLGVVSCVAQLHACLIFKFSAWVTACSSAPAGWYWAQYVFGLHLH